MTNWVDLICETGGHKENHPGLMTCWTDLVFDGTLTVQKGVRLMTGGIGPICERLEGLCRLKRICFCTRPKNCGLQGISCQTTTKTGVRPEDSQENQTGSAKVQFSLHRILEVGHGSKRVDLWAALV